MSLYKLISPVYTSKSWKVPTVTFQNCSYWNIKIGVSVYARNNMNSSKILNNVIFMYFYIINYNKYFTTL
jgi:hypothetical protein